MMPHPMATLPWTAPKAISLGNSVIGIPWARSSLPERVVTTCSAGRPPCMAAFCNAFVKSWTFFADPPKSPVSEVMTTPPRRSCCTTSTGRATP